MWRDIAMANRKNIAQSVDGLIGELKKFQTALRGGKPSAVEKFFAVAKTRRDDWCSGRGSDSSE
jgi:prephenate dehydrogenase